MSIIIFWLTSRSRTYCAKGCDITNFAMLAAVAARIDRCVHYNAAKLQKSFGYIFLHELRCHIRTAASSEKDKWRTLEHKMIFLLVYVRLVLLSDTRKIVQVWNKFLDCGSIQPGIFYCHLQEINYSVLTDFFIVIIIINIIIISIISIIRFQFFYALLSWGLWASKIKIKKLLLPLLFLV